MRERIREQKELAREEVKLKREFEREQRIVHKVTQERQVTWQKIVTCIARMLNK